MPFSIVIIKRGMQTLHFTLKRFRLTGMMLMHYSHLKHLLINKKMQRHGYTTTVFIVVIQKISNKIEFAANDDWRIVIQY